MKSLPAKQQLEEYAARFPEKEQTGFLLLSLTRPTFLPLNETAIRLPDGTVWQYLTYRELSHGKLLDLLPHSERVDSYHGQLLRDYIDFITHLNALQMRFAIDWNNERQDSSSPEVTSIASRTSVCMT